jgi:hypothetical protein
VWQSATLPEVRHDPRSWLTGVIALGKVADPVLGQPSPNIDYRETQRSSPAVVRSPGVQAWGWFGPITLVSALMLGLVSVGDALSRSGYRHGGIPYWIGLTVPIVLIAYRQTSLNVPRRERIALCVVAGLFLYLVKVIENPFIFTFGDELNQAYNSNTVLHSGGLFASNPLLPATAEYPGLASVTAAVASLTHLSVFGAGLIVIGVARTVMMLALYLLLERAIHSPQVAGLGTLVYTAAPNFLFFTGEVSYESLGLPLAAAALCAIVAWTNEPSGRRTTWAIAGLVLIAAVVPTHHMTSYVLIGALLGMSLAHSPKRDLLKRSALPFTLYAVGMTVAWLILVASLTVGYLEPVFTSALRSTVDVITHEGTGSRKPFASPVGAGVPLWDRWTALAATALIIGLTPLGLMRASKLLRRPVVVVLGAAAIAYLLTFALRLVPSAWEIASRSSEFLFIGVGLVLALALARPRGDIIHMRTYRMTVALTVGIIFAGGAAVGWRPEIRLAQALRVAAGKSVIEPEGLTAARWSSRWIVPDKRAAFGANGSDSRLLLVYGGQSVRTGGIGGADLAVEMPGLEEWQIQLLKDKSIRYVLMNRRKITDDTLAGYFFPNKISPPTWRQTIPAAIYNKFDRSMTSRIFDSGNITIYDVNRLDPVRDSRAATR